MAVQKNNVCVPEQLRAQAALIAQRKGRSID
jgi:hypothetical protein